MSAYDDLPESERKRLLKDEDTLRAMGRIYCEAHHQGEKDIDGLCPECAACIAYSIQRTRKCPKLHKGNCDQCEIRCYAPEMRQQIRTIMAYAGPRMIYRHPVMAVRHLQKKFSK